MTKETESGALRSRLAELKREADDLNSRAIELRDMRANGRTAAQLDAAAKELIGGRTMTLIDPTAELHDVEAQLAINARARDVLAERLGRIELADGYKVAAPLFERALSHYPRLLKALEAVEAELRETRKDVRAFEEINIPLAGLQARYPGEKAPYAEWQLSPLAFGWNEDFLGDGLNPSKLDRWRAECADLGLDAT